MKDRNKLNIFYTTLCLTLAFISITDSIYSQWQIISNISTTKLKCVKFFNEYTGLVCGAGGIWRSTNSGVNWVQVLSGVNMNSISAPNSANCYAVGDSGKIYKSDNNGVNWVQIYSITANNLYGVSFLTSSAGYTVGQNGVILRTNNAGSTWISQYNPLAEDLNAIIMTSASTAYGVGSVNYERFISTGNGGINWIYTINNGGNCLKSLSSISGLKIEVVGTNGIIRYSTNGGTWTLIPSGTTTQLNCIVFPDTAFGYIAGNNGTIIHSTNGGINWSLQPNITASDLFSVSFINTTTGWVVGQNGIVLRTGIPVYVSQKEENLPLHFKLYQNYPNPFNLSTKIDFEVKKPSRISLKLYSMDGREVDELLDYERFPAGNYYVDFDADDDLASGVYLYQMTGWTEDKKEIFIDIKKMVLLK